MCTLHEDKALELIIQPDILCYQFITEPYIYQERVKKPKVIVPWNILKKVKSVHKHCAFLNAL